MTRPETPTPALTPERVEALADFPIAGGSVDAYGRTDALASLIGAWLAEERAETLREAADAWSQGEWANTPRRADRVADRIGAAQHVGGWLRERAARSTP